MAAGLTLTTNPTTVTNPIVFAGTAVYGAAGTAWSVTNQTVIAGAGAGGVGIQLEAGGTVANQAGANIVANNRGVNIFGGPGTVANSGFIDSPNGAAIYTQGAGTITNLGTIANGDGLAAFTVALAGGGSVTNGASGDTTALISGGGIVLSQPGTVTNFGTISDLTAEAILFGAAGANRLIDEPGSQILVPSGALVLSVGGSSVIELAGTAPGMISGIGANYQGFQTVQFDAGAQWTAGVSTGGPYPNFTGFAQGDILALAGVTANNGSYSGGVLTLKEGGTTVLTLNLTTPVASPVFDVVTNGSVTDVYMANPSPPAATTAVLFMGQSSSGNYEIYDLGGNAILAAYALGQIPAPLQVAGVGGFDGADTSDMILRNASTGAFQVDDVSGNTITNSVALGQVGPEWQVSGFGDFSGHAGETDMLMQATSGPDAGDFEVYDISNNAITNAVPMGQVGSAWVVAGFGDFSGRAGETGDMLMRNSNTGQFEVYDITNNTITSAGPMGQVGLEWQVAGFGDFSGNPNETDMLMRDTNNGDFEIYDISNNTITSAAPMGQVGMEWQVAGFGSINGASDMLMRDTNNGDFEIYDIANNTIVNAMSMGQVGLEWSVAGIAADPPGGSALANAQLAQAMASYAPVGGTLDTESPLSQPIVQPTPGAALTAPNGQNLPAG